MNERKTITLGVILESTRMIAPVLDIGGRHEGARESFPVLRATRGEAGL